MIVKLPHIDPIDTLNLPKDFEERVRESFRKYTEFTSKDYTHEDKLMYLDNLQKFLHPGEAEEYVKDMIMERAEYEIDEFEDFPDKEDFWCFEFMAECFEAGNKEFCPEAPFEKNHRDNSKTLKAILEMIKIISNWEE